MTKFCIRTESSSGTVSYLLYNGTVYSVLVKIITATVRLFELATKIYSIPNYFQGIL